MQMTAGHHTILVNKYQSRQLSAIRDLKGKQFDFLAGVLFSEDFTVQRACLVPISVVEGLAKYRKHTNAWIFYLSDEVWGQAGVVDVTREVRKAQTG